MSTLTKMFLFQHISLQCFILHAAWLAVLDIDLLHCYFVILLLCYFVSLQWPHVRIVRPGILLPSDLTLPVSSLPILLPTQTHKPKERQGEKKTQNGKVGNQSKVRPILGNIFNVFVFSEKIFLQHVLPANQIWEACVVLRAIFWSVRSATLAFLLY